MYSFALAERLGITRTRLLAECDAAELTRWMAWDRVREPSVQDHRHAQLCHLICVVAGSKEARLEDFLPRRPRVAGPMSGAEIEMRFRAIAATKGA